MKILDVCCGSRMFWYDKQEPHTTYMDILKAVYTAMDRGNERGGRIMLHKYNLKKPVEAEQFDGSEEMMDRYPISIGTDKFGTWYKILTVEGFHWLYEGDWIVSGNGDYLVIEKNLFRRICEKCD